MLFTGDTLFVKHDRWVAAVLESSDRESHIESLALLRGLDFDVLVPWVGFKGQQPYAVATKTHARDRIDAVLDRLRRGANG